MTARDKLIVELQKRFPNSIAGHGSVADFILADRRKVLEPVKTVREKFLETKKGKDLRTDVAIAFRFCVAMSTAIGATLKRAGDV